MALCLSLRCRTSRKASDHYCSCSITAKTRRSQIVFAFDLIEHNTWTSVAKPIVSDNILHVDDKRLRREFHLTALDLDIVVVQGTSRRIMLKY